MEEEDRLRNKQFRFSPGLEIITNIDDVEVRISGEKVGRTPWETNSLASGAYRISLERVGYQPQEFNVVLRSDRRTVVWVEMIKPEGSLVLRGLPPNASVEIDRTRVEGSTVTLDAGVHSISVEAFGWEDANFTVTVNAGETIIWDYPGKKSTFSLQIVELKPKRLNPGDQRGFRIRWQAEAPGNGELTLFSPHEEQLFQLALTADKRDNIVEWQPAANLDDGEYTLFLTGTGVDGNTVEVQRSLIVDSRFFRAARLSHTGVPGLMFSQGTAMLPPSIWQVSTAAEYYSDFSGDDAIEGVPASLSFRMSPVTRFEVNGRFAVSARFPEENSSLAFSLAASWRTNKQAGPFTANLALLYYFSGYLADLSRTPSDDLTPALPGVQLSLPMEYKIGKWSVMLSPALNMSFLGNKPDDWSFAVPVGVGGALGLGAYREGIRTMWGASVTLRSPLLPRLFPDWTVYSGLEGRLNLPGDASFIALSAGLRAYPGKPVVTTGIEFGIVN